MLNELVRHTRVIEIVGDMIRVEAGGAALGDMAVVDNLTGEEGITLDDFVMWQKSMLLDMVFLQQDAFDAVDASMPQERQLESFQILKGLIEASYNFKDKDGAREFFTRLTGIYKNFNYSAPETPEYSRFRKEIDDLVAEYKRGTVAA